MLRSVSAEVITYRARFRLFNLCTRGLRLSVDHPPEINGLMSEACNGLVNKDAFEIKKKNIGVTNVSAIYFAMVAATPQSHDHLSHPLACDISPIFTAANKKTLLV